MAHISFKHSGNFENTDRFLKKMRRKEIFEALDRFGAMGVAALASATPVLTGQTAGSWGYEIERSGKTYSIIWTNDNEIPGHGPLVIMLQYGHGTGTGGYVQGRDFINPAIKPVFDAIANSVWNEVINA
mgnify:CR=1 FL=1